MYYKPAGAATGDNLVERINILRGLAIVGVVAIHTSAHFQYVKGLAPVVYANVVIDALAHYAVPLFVLLSGLTLARRYRPQNGPLSPGAFYRRRLTKVVPPYIVFSLLYLLLFAVEYQLPSASSVVFALATGNAYYHLWFVAMLVQLYLLFPLLMPLLQKAGKRRAWLILFLTLFLQIGWNLGSPVAAAALPARPLFQAVLSDRIFLSHIFYFVLGMVAGLNAASFDRQIRSLPARLMCLAVIVPVTGTSAAWITAVRSYGSLDAAPPGQFIASVAVEPLLYLAVIAILWQLTPRLQQGPPALRNGLTQLGIMSFTIYLVHVFFQVLLARDLAPFGVTPAAWGFYPLMLLWTLLLSYFAARLFSAVPLGDFLAGAPRNATEGS